MTANKDTWILYRTENLINCKIYVGVHKLSIKHSKYYLGSGDSIKAAIKKYGKDKFCRTTLAEFSCAEDAYAAEAEMVDADFIKREDTYNISLGGWGGVGMTPEIRAKIGAAHRGKTLTEEQKKQIGDANRGRKLSKEHIAIIAARSKGNKNNLGRVFSAEVRARVGAASKGRTHTPEAKAKISAAHKGKITKEETKNKMSAAKEGRKTGSENHRSLPILINGIYYESTNLAAKAENIHFQTILYRLKTSSPKFSEWRYATPEEKAAHSLEASRQSSPSEA
jgi:hypothetical protein